LGPMARQKALLKTHDFTDAWPACQIGAVEPIHMVSPWLDGNV
jgi:hypothetical protein